MSNVTKILYPKIVRVDGKGVGFFQIDLMTFSNREYDRIPDDFFR